jgi:hypothetical protein
VPAPVVASPPDTLQVTEATFPFESAAENCSTGVPFAFVALHPVQLVSTELVPGETERDALLEFALAVPPPPQPAIASVTAKGPAAKRATRKNSLPRARLGLREPSTLVRDPDLTVSTSCAQCNFYRMPFESSFHPSAMGAPRSEGFARAAEPQELSFDADNTVL